jgi:hypothetical protein
MKNYIERLDSIFSTKENTLKKITEEKITEGSVASKEDLMEYAMTLGKKAFGDDLDEKKIKGIVDKAIKDSDGDWAKAAGFVTGSFNS